MPQAARVIVADESPIYRHGLRTLLHENGGYRVVGEGATAADVRHLVRTLAADALVVGNLEREDDTRELCERLAREHDVAVLRLLHRRTLETLRRNDPESGGLRGIVRWSCEPEELLQALAALLRTTGPTTAAHGREEEERAGHGLDGTSALFAGLPDPTLLPAANAESLALLTPTEQRVLRSLAANRTSREIAAELSVSVRTVQNHRANICAKLQLRGPHKLLAFALEHRQHLETS